jgi:hypothetical protein
LKRIALLLIGVVALAGAITFMTAASGQADEGSSPIYGVKIPANYREWKLIAVDNLLVAGKTDQLRAQLGNDVAIKALHATCFPCHAPAKDHDYVFTHYAP